MVVGVVVSSLLLLERGSIFRFLGPMVMVSSLLGPSPPCCYYYYLLLLLFLLFLFLFSVFSVFSPLRLLFQCLDCIEIQLLRSLGLAFAGGAPAAAAADVVH